MLNASEIAKGVVDNWVTSQLRPEGRAGIYTDDEIVLQIEISEAIETAVLTERERCAEIAIKSTKRMSVDYYPWVTGERVAKLIRQKN